MRVLIAAFGSHGDVLPLIAIGGELASRGHEVIMAGAEPFAAAAASVGVSFEQLLSEADYRAAMEDGDLWRPLRGMGRLFSYAERAIRPIYDFIGRHAAPKKTIIVASTLALGARLAQDALKLPLVTTHLSPMTIQSRHEAPRLPLVGAANWLPPRLKWELHLGADEWFVDPHIKTGLNRLRAELGLAPVKRLRHWWHAPRRVLLMCPPWFAERQPDWPEQVRQIGFPRADRLGAVGAATDPRIERFLADGEAPVAITFGTAMRRGAPLYRAAMEAAERVGRRSLVMTGETVEIPPALRGRALVTPYAPFGEVLPRCAAFVHHGGVGTVARAFAASTPQLVVPLAFDQFDNAERVRRLGCGFVIRRRLFGARSGASRLRAIFASREIGEGTRRAAALSAGEDAVAAAADAVEAEFAAVAERRRGRKAASPIEA